MIYYNYYLACSTDPGTPAVNWIDSHADKDLILEKNEDRKMPSNWLRFFVGPKLLKRNEDIVLTPISDFEKVPLEERFKYCHKCQNYKPYRTHHCSVCKKCILKFDHHCPWINNCVGYYNHAHFIRFLIFVDISCSILCLKIILFSLDCYDSFLNEQFIMRAGYKPYPLNTAQVILLFLIFVMTGMVLMAVGILSLYQIYYVSTNTTTVESFEKDKVYSFARVRYPYALGCINNIKQVLGDSILLWLYPQKMQGNGINFYKSCNEEWPPSWFHKDNKYASSDSESEEEENRISNGRVRRGSEGYVVRSYTVAEREAMVQDD